MKAPTAEQRKAKADYRATLKLLSDNGVPQSRVAEAFGRSLNLIARWNMLGSGRYPKEGWEEVLADLCEREADKGLSDAHERAETLQEQANALYARRNGKASAGGGIITGGER